MRGKCRWGVARSLLYPRARAFSSGALVLVGRDSIISVAGSTRETGRPNRLSSVRVSGTDSSSGGERVGDIGNLGRVRDSMRNQSVLRISIRVLRVTFYEFIHRVASPRSRRGKRSDPSFKRLHYLRARGALSRGATGSKSARRVRNENDALSDCAGSVRSVSGYLALTVNLSSTITCDRSSALQ
jgi:hypothetical protein